MVEQRSTSTETTDASRMEYLLGALRACRSKIPLPPSENVSGFCRISNCGLVLSPDDRLEHERVFDRGSGQPLSSPCSPSSGFLQ